MVSIYLLTFCKCFNNFLFKSLPDLIPFEGALKANNLLEKAKYIAHKKVTGPETIVFAKDGNMYTGLMNGQIVKIDVAGEVHKIVQMGDQTDDAICSKYILIDLDKYSN